MASPRNDASLSGHTVNLNEDTTVEGSLTPGPQKETVAKRIRSWRPKGHVLPYVTKRLALLPFQLFGILVTVFVIVRLLPADPVALKVGALATPESVRQAEAQLGLNVSIWSQLVDYLKGLARGSLGESWNTSVEVTRELSVRFPVTLQLIILSFIIALIIGVGLGAIAALRPESKIDRSIFLYGLFAGAQPEFWWGLIFIAVFAGKLGWFPIPVGFTDPIDTPQITHFVLIDTLITGHLASFWSAFQYFLLPALTFAFVLNGPILKMTRQTMVTILDADFMTQARAAGLKPLTVSKYAIHNALPPVITLTGVLIGYQIGGAVLIEKIFSMNGLAQYALDRTLTLDYPAMQGAVLLMSAFALIVYLVVDVITALIDPRAGL